MRRRRRFPLSLSDRDVRVFGLTVALLGVLFVAVAVALVLSVYQSQQRPPAIPPCFPLYNVTGNVSTYCPVAPTP